MKLLLHGSPQQSCWGRHLRHSLGALPNRDFIPRITLCDSLVLTAAQWRVAPDEIMNGAAPALSKLRSLLRLRDRLGLPRWVFVSSEMGGRSLPCDLESLRAIRVLEQTASGARSTAIVVEEMVPTVQELTTFDATTRADAVAAQLMLRFPCDESPTAMAVRLGAGSRLQSCNESQRTEVETTGHK